jgi:hypothetical protein
VTDKPPEEEGRVTRLSFLKASAGAAAGAAAIGVPVASAMSADQQGVPVEPRGATPREPVVAYVRDADRGEVTLMSGTSEITYRDRNLVKRLINAAPNGAQVTGEGTDVIAP